MAAPALPTKILRRITGVDPFPQPPIIRLRLPVVLMHGFGIIAAMRRGGHLFHEAEELRRHGVWAYAPNVSAYDTVPLRCAAWEQRLEHVMEETGCDRLNLIAHSMGGLDARYLISEMGLHRHVATLTTISSPHHGTAVASWIHEQPHRLRRLTARLVDFVGAHALDDATADVERAVRELTPEYVRDVFNPGVPDHPDVRYWSYAGAAGKGTETPINPLLRLLNSVLYKREGINDGFVSAESARWGTFLGIIPADHPAQVGIHFSPRPRFDSSALYRAIVRRLAEEGF